MRYQGRLSNWNDVKGYGFVTPNGGGDRAFVHIKAFSDRRRRPVEGDLITYAIARDSRNRIQATDIRYPSTAKVTEARAAGGAGFAFVLIVTFACIVVALTVLGKIPFLAPFVYALVSIATFLAYGFDKSAAMTDRWRTAESTLHLLSLLGGWPGALAAQKVLRHKSKKVEFLVLFWVTVGLNCTALAWAVTDDGRLFLKTQGWL